MSKYVYVENGAVVEGPIPLPKSSRNVSNLDALSDPELIDRGWYPVDDQTPAISNYERLGDYQFDIQADKVVVTRSVVDLPTADILDIKTNEINGLRESKIADGLVYTFPDTGTQGTVQLRNQTDIRNVTGLGTAAHVMVTYGMTDNVWFTDEENVVHSLTPTEAVQMGLAVTNFISQLYIQARQKKDELAASPDPKNYDIEAGW